MKRACLLAVALTLGATLPRAAAPAITIDASTPAGKVSPLLYGLMTEEINHSYDGGPRQCSWTSAAPRFDPSR